jgi:uncharacterized protein YqgV (UPF0045/DUF77 family)
VSTVSAQISVYPLRQASIGSAVREVVRVLRQRGLTTHVGEMSTLLWGEEETIFDALKEAFHRAAERGDTVMVVTLSNACSLPEALSYRVHMDKDQHARVLVAEGPEDDEREPNEEGRRCLTDRRHG